MRMISFFGGLFIGLWLGWVVIALLSMASKEREEERIYQEALSSNKPASLQQEHF